mmetsp:Transcript_38944/g.43872  ORF Transcript_38944/g.43872 Transcript_38944/m.43872 type:complete len:544 (-) Transcript_38944:199-1830(-)
MTSSSNPSSIHAMVEDRDHDHDHAYDDSNNVCMTKDHSHKNNKEKNMTLNTKLKCVKLQGYSEDTLLPKAHDDTWHEAQNIYQWQAQAQMIVVAQQVPTWLAEVPAIFFHFLLKRDWGMAFGPFFAFAIFADGSRSLDLYLAGSVGGVLCGVFKHVFRSPRPFWIVPEVVLRHGVEELSWSTPSAHSAIQGAIASVLIYHNHTDITSWVANTIVLLFVMFSRLYLAVHWPQDVVIGAFIGMIAGTLVCVSNVHTVLLDFAETHHPFGGLLSLTIGVGYYLVVYLLVQLLDYYSDSRPVPEAAILRYKRGVARSIQVLEDQSTEEVSKKLDENVLASTVELTVDELSLREISTIPQRVLPKSTSIPKSNKSGFGSDEEEVSNEFTTTNEPPPRFLPRQTGTWFLLADSDEVAAQEKDREQELEKNRAHFFFREDIVFNPDDKERFAYNAINVLGSYFGVAFYTCMVADSSDVEFVPNLRWLAAIYAAGISFAAIVYLRTIARSSLKKNQFKLSRKCVYFFLGFYTYGLFPISYLTLMNENNKNE